jgi:hypothetical protein
MYLHDSVFPLPDKPKFEDYRSFSSRQDSLPDITTHCDVFSRNIFRYKRSAHP